MDAFFHKKEIKGTEMVNAFDPSEDWMLAFCTYAGGDDASGPYFEWIGDEPLRVYWDQRGSLDICIAQREVINSTIRIGQREVINSTILFIFTTVLVTDNAQEAAEFIKDYVRKGLAS